MVQNAISWPRRDWPATKWLPPSPWRDRKFHLFRLAEYRDEYELNRAVGGRAVINKFACVLKPRLDGTNGRIKLAVGQFATVFLFHIGTIFTAQGAS